MPEKEKSGLLQGWLSILAHPIQSLKGLGELFSWGKKGDAMSGTRTKGAKEHKGTR